MAAMDPRKITRGEAVRYHMMAPMSRRMFMMSRSKSNRILRGADRYQGQPGGGGQSVRWSWVYPLISLLPCQGSSCGALHEYALDDQLDALPQAVPEKALRGLASLHASLGMPAFPSSQIAPYDALTRSTSPKRPTRLFGWTSLAEWEDDQRPACSSRPPSPAGTAVRGTTLSAVSMWLCS